MNKRKPFAYLRDHCQSIRYYKVQLSCCILLIIAVWSFVFGVLSCDYSTTVKNIEQTNDYLVRAFEEHVRRSLHAFDATLLLIKAEYEQEKMTTSVSTIISQAKQNPLINQVAILDASGDAIITLTSSRPGINMSYRSYFREHAAKDTQKVLISEPVLGRVTNKPTILMSRRLN